jgi:hypothetical protein
MRARLIELAVIERVIVADPDDDVVLACAAAARAACVGPEPDLPYLPNFEMVRDRRS